jgi:tetratricopeptide (TPR) repeat protein
VPGLRVAARSSSFRFKDGSADFKEIRDKLQVSTILQGSVRKQGNKARITVQLIKASDGFELWADSFDKDLSDILGVQQDIAKAVVGKLKVTVLGGSAPAGTTNASAYDAFLQGLYLARRGSRESLEKAVAFYEQSLQLDPKSARAAAALGSALTDQAQHSYIPRDEGYRKARDVLDRAISLDPALASPNSTLAWIAMYHDWNWKAAAFYSDKALKLDPGSAVALNTAATLAMVTGHRDESIALYQRAIRIDPLSSAKLINQGLVLYYSGRFAEAEASLRKALVLAPDREDVHMYLSLIRLAQGNTVGAREEAAKEKNPEHRLFATSLASPSAESLEKLAAAAGADSPCMIAEAYAYRGDKDRAFEWLDKAYEARDSELTEIRSNPLFAKISGDARFEALVKKIGL